MVSKVSAPLRSSSTGPPLDACLLLSFRVRSGLTGFQVLPASVDLKSTLPPRYKVFGSVGATAMGEVQLKRYFSSDGGRSSTPCKYGRMKSLIPVRASRRWMEPFCESA